jgi:serine/threonine protein kinase
MLAINQILQGRYRIIRQLGSGGMGAVYEAEDTKRFGRSVALKEILIDFARIPNPKQQEMVRRAFEREAKILTQVEDDAFPKVIEYFLETDRQFLVMELIPGDDLAALLEKNQKPFAVEEALGWADQLLDALDYLHTLNPPIIHRDIKPHNLKLNSRRKIKLLDFGIAKDTGAEMSSTIANQTFVGATLNYSPLEQLLRIPLYYEPLKSIYREKVENILCQPANARSDIYALGATLYHLLTNDLPVDAYNRALRIWAGEPDPLPSPRELNPNIPPEISDILLKSMEVECENRFATALEMKTAISEVIFNAKQRKETLEREKWLEEQRKIPIETASFAERQPALNTQPASDEATIPIIDEYKIEDTAGATPAITEPLHAENQIAEDWKTDASSNQPTQSEASSMDYTAASFLDGIKLGHEKEIAPAPRVKVEETPSHPPADEPKQKKNRALILLAAVIALLILGIGTFGILLINKMNSVNANQPAANTTPSVVPTESPLVTPTVEAVVSPAPTVQNNSETPNPTAATKPAPTVENSTPATPNPTVKVTPAPTKTKVPVTPAPTQKQPVSVCKFKDEKTGLIQIVSCSQCTSAMNCTKIQ